MRKEGRESAGKNSRNVEGEWKKYINVRPADARERSEGGAADKG
jgi:hypothetical protein